MFYVSRKVGRRFAVVDTSDNVEELYFRTELERIVNNGVQIKGAEYIHNVFTVTPIIVVDSYKKAAKNKLLTGTSTGYKGFDLDINTETGEVVAKSLTDDFKNYIIENAYRGRYVLVIPDIVTVLGEDFLSDFPSLRKKSGEYLNIFISVVLPKSLKKMRRGALTWWGISDITFNSVIERLAFGANKGTLSISSRSDTALTLPIKVLEKSSLVIKGSNLKVIDLSYAEIIDSDAITSNFYDYNRIFKLGKRLLNLYNITEPISILQKSRWNSPNQKFPSVSKQMMGKAVILDIPDDNIIERICMGSNITTDNFDDEVRRRYVYILLLSSKSLRRFTKIKIDIASDCAVGIISYENEEGYKWLLDNLEYCCQHPKRCFVNALDENSFGTLTYLAIK